MVTSIAKSWHVLQPTIFSGASCPEDATKFYFPFLK
jgi:hypothetical protein